MQDYIGVGGLHRHTAVQLCPGYPTLADQCGKLGSLSTKMAGFQGAGRGMTGQVGIWEGIWAERVWCEGPALGAR